MKLFSAVLTLWILLALSACDSDQATPSPINDPHLVLTVKQSGGCQRAGPNCSAYFLYSDGTVNAARTEDTSVIEITTSIDRELTQSFVTLIENEDFIALRQSLPEGRCAGCVDGTDIEYIINTNPDSANPVSISFSSIEHQLDASSNFFATADVLYSAMKDVAPLEFRTR